MRPVRAPPGLAATEKRTVPLRLPPAPPVISIQLSVLSTLHWQLPRFVTTWQAPLPPPAGKVGGSAAVTVNAHGVPGGSGVVVVGNSVVDGVPVPPPLPARATPAATAPPASARGKAAECLFEGLSGAEPTALAAVSTSWRAASKKRITCGEKPRGSSRRSRSRVAASLNLARAASSW